MTTDTEKITWTAGQTGLSPTTIKRYSTMLGYPRRGSGSHLRYRHTDVEAMCTVAEFNGVGGVMVSGEVLEKMLKSLAAIGCYELRYGQMWLTVTRVTLLPPLPPPEES